ncbi:hypothetical protein ACFWDI_35540 [Streptomyces sp. NPDC060064]|uniref:hypothetical protein n=1 Tax=Streptomyces sp. NPDC060064 TaxID=3347049 RepID=UPI0036A1E467
MKYSRVAAIVAGSVAAMGTASPAVAATTPMPPTTLKAGLAQALGQTLPSSDESTVTKVADTAIGLNNVKGSAPQEALKSAGEVTPMLGGVQLGG